ncbi:MAG: stage II sporulation protein E [Eubacteriales bacterium]
MQEKIEIYPFQRAGRDGKKAGMAAQVKEQSNKNPLLLREKLGRVVTPQVFLLSLTGFFLGRAVLLGELLPCGAAFVAAASQIGSQAGLAVTIAVLLGFTTILKGVPLAGAALVVACAWLMVKAAPGGIKKTPWAIPGLVLALTLITKSSILAFNQPSAYGYFSVLFEAVFAAILTFVFTGALAAWRKSTREETFTGEDLFYILLLFGCFIAGTADLKYGLVSMKGVLSKLAIMLAAFIGGTGIGAAAGAVAGIIPGLSFTAIPSVVGAYSFSGLLAGLCRFFGKPGVVTGFLLGNIILTVYVAGYGDLTAVLAETGLSTVVFLLIPSVLLNDLAVTLGQAGRKAEVGEEVREEGQREFFNERIRNWARVFQELSHTFEQVSSASGQSIDEYDFKNLFNKIGEKVCSGCSFYRTCWEKDFYKTYQFLLDAFTLVEIYGSVSIDKFPEEIRRRCTRVRELAITISCLYETYSQTRYWSRRLLESREIVSEQLRGIAGVIEKLPGDFEFEDEAADIASDLRRKLKKEGIPVDYLSVIRQEGGGFEINLTLIPCGEVLMCGNLAPMLTGLLGQSYTPAANVCTLRDGDDTCSLRFYPSVNFTLELGAARAGKSGSLVTGDSYSYFYLKGGRFGLVLSDGMGVGPRAALESGTTISLLHYLLESGFSHDLAIKTLNSVLALRSPGESFATVDLTIIDLYSGQAELLKIGAEPSFIMREGRVNRIGAGSLPVGILEEVEAVTLNKQMEPGDVLVMVTDGVLNSNRGAVDKEEWMIKILNEVDEIPPQEMAELILKLAQTGAGGPVRAPDDMAVLVAKLIRQKKPAH